MTDGTGRPVDFVFLDSNASFERITGLKRSDIVGRRASEVLPDMMRDQFDWLGFYGSVAFGCETVEIERVFPPDDRRVRIRVIPLSEPNTFATILEDLSADRDGVTAVEPSGRRDDEGSRDLFFREAPDGIFLVDEQGLYRDANPAALAMLGYEKRELLGLSIRDLLPTDQTAAGIQSFKNLKTYGRSSCELKLLRKDGGFIWVALDAVRNPVGGYLGYCKNITLRKYAEERNDLSLRAMEVVDQPIIITDSNGTIQEVNRAFLDLYGFQRDEVLGHNPRILNPGWETYVNLGYSYEDYVTLFDEMWRTLKDPSIGTWQGTVINRCRNGSLLWVRLIVNAVYDEGGRIKNLIGLPIDISESRNREKISKIELYSTIAAMAELRDEETSNHMRRVGLFSKILAKSLGMPEKYCEDLELFAPMHDIGKVGVPDSLLLARRKLTPEEWTEMKRHTVMGHNIVKDKQDLALVAAITLRHHERWDGTGYPDGVTGEEIPLSARITALADVYDALRSARPYKEPWTHDRAVEEIISQAGRQFDPRIVEVFRDSQELFARVFEELK
ncbi:MAG: PAS domain S-box protein [Treponema sp.]|nr:PAS domain S-box protein [Treponema sp.]